MTRTEQKADIPKMVAAAGTQIPRLALSLGVSYLRLKRDARRASATFTKELERDGVPPGLARQLGDSYASELSLRRLMNMRGGGFFRGLTGR